ncbi:MAG: hypothetical protein H0U57_08810 [Tatlockia sp.]|nr:hypothetical protein [Tatlockia sp.]
MILTQMAEVYSKEPNEENAKKLLEIIQAQILFSNFKTGLGGETVRNNDYGIEIKVPKNMVQLLDQIEIAKASKNWGQALKTISGMAGKVESSIFRDKQTQDFYTQIAGITFHAKPASSNNHVNKFKQSLSNLKASETKEPTHESQHNLNRNR